ncbi:MAG: quinolinate synthase NadA [Muribaculaceae bacterium]|nr:quinolinate synthase NadA [Muribaculaceae bacterium]
MNVENRSVTTPKEKDKLIEEIKRLKREKKAVVLAHYYQRPEIQDIADHIGDSLALARDASTLKDVDIIVLCGVHFMGETAKILSQDKKVLIPDIEAGCSLADSCDANEFKEFLKKYPDHTVISYVNTSVGVKALTDVLVTSGNAVKIVETFPKDEKIVFGPDRNLGNYINSLTGRDMVLWDGACHVHEQFSMEKLLELKKEYPKAKVLVHPECKKALRLVADKVGSTAALIDYARNSEAAEFIVVTESGIMHELEKICPDKHFIAAPPEDGSCACNECGYMKLNTLEKLYECLRDEKPEIKVDAEVAEAAKKPIERMLELS